MKQIRIKRKTDLLYFDLETEGLDPMTHAIRCVGTIDPETGEIDIKTAATPAVERDILVELITTLMLTKRWGGWNITEFDLGFIAVRAYKHELGFPVIPVRDEPYVGKYGNPRVIVPARMIHDLAYDYQDRALELDAKWSLHGLAEAIGWQPQTELTGADMPNALMHEVVLHVVDDLSAIYRLVNEFGIPEETI